MGRLAVSVEVLTSVGCLSISAASDALAPIDVVRHSRSISAGSAVVRPFKRMSGLLHTTGHC
jgi:hypothetical protein